MNIEFDTQSGAAYWKISQEPITKTVEVSQHVMCDIDEAGNLCGVEFLNYSPVQWAAVEKNLLTQNA